MRARVAGSFRRSISLASPPSCAQGGMKAENVVEPGGIGVGVGGDVDARSARGLILATTSGMRPQFALPATLRCQISTGMCASRPMRTASSMRCDDGIALVAHVRGVDAAEFRRLRQPARSTPRFWRKARAHIRSEVDTPTAPSRMASRTSCLHLLQLRGRGLPSSSPSTMRRTCVAPT